MTGDYRDLCIKEAIARIAAWVDAWLEASSTPVEVRR